MAGVSVTIESLTNLKRAFSDFRTEIEDFSDKVRADAEQIILEVRQSLKKQEALVRAQEDKVSSLVDLLEQIQNAIILLNSKISSLKAAIPDLERQKAQLEARLSVLENKLRLLESMRRNSDDDAGASEQQIHEIENQIRDCERNIDHVSAQLSSAKQQVSEYERKLSEMKNNRIKTENALASAKNELNRSKSKLERLSAAGDSVEREIGNLLTVSRKFEQSASSSSASSQAGLNKCIASIDEYLATSLSSDQSSGTVEYHPIEYTQLNNNGNVEHLVYDQPLVINSDSLPPAPSGCLSFKNQAEAAEWAESAFSRWRQTLTPTQEEYIRQYGGNLYDTINRESRLDHLPTAQISEISDEIDNALSTASLPCDMLLYRGLSENAVLDMARHAGGPLEQGITLNELAFLSTSMTPDTSFCNSCSCIMRLTAVAGLQGAPLLYGDLATVSQESEILFSRNHGIYIQNISRCPRSDLVPNSQDNSSITVIDAVLSIY